jgi:hypothetical protein
MIDRLWWFVSGALAGGWVTVRALRRRPSARDVGAAAVASGADLLDLAARIINPPVRS